MRVSEAEKQTDKVICVIIIILAFRWQGPRHPVQVLSSKHHPRCFAPSRLAGSHWVSLSRCIFGCMFITGWVCQDVCLDAHIRRYNYHHALCETWDVRHQSASKAVASRAKKMEWKIDTSIFLDRNNISKRDLKKINDHLIDQSLPFYDQKIRSDHFADERCKHCAHFFSRWWWIKSSVATPFVSEFDGRNGIHDLFFVRGDQAVRPVEEWQQEAIE